MHKRHAMATNTTIDFDTNIERLEQLPGAMAFLLKEIAELKATVQKLTSPATDAPASLDGYLTRKEVLAKLRVCAKTLRDLTSEGKIKGYRIGGRIKYNPAEVEAAVSKNLIAQ